MVNKFVLKEQFLHIPHLPKSVVRLCCIGQGHPMLRAALEKQGITVLEASAYAGLAGACATHADMLLHDLGDGRAVVAKGADTLTEQLEAHGFTVEQAEISARYPYDIALNCFSLSDFLFCNREYTAEVILRYYKSTAKAIVPIRQGYAKCSTCIVDQNSIITADASIAKAAEGRGLQVLHITVGYILLPGYGTGFIGGACGLLAPDLLAFTGKITKHPDYKRIADFCGARGVNLLELTDSLLLDIGGILPLMQD